MTDEEVQARLRAALREVHDIRTRLRETTLRGRLLMLLRQLRSRNRTPIPDRVTDER